MDKQYLEDEDYNRFYKYVSEEELTEAEKEYLNIGKPSEREYSAEVKNYVLENILHIRCMQIQIILLKLLGETGNKQLDAQLMFINRHIRVIRLLLDQSSEASFLSRF